MKIKALQISGIRAFENTGILPLSPSCNLFVGENNSGKSTILRSVLAFQGFGFGGEDIRPYWNKAFHGIILDKSFASSYLQSLQSAGSRDRFIYRIFKGEMTVHDDFEMINIQDSGGEWPINRPYNYLVPFIARRKAAQFNHNITSGFQNQVSGTFDNLYSRIDLVATSGHPMNPVFQKAISEIVGVQITTRSTSQGKEAGFYYDKNNFISLERMGDGVSEMVGLIVELCLEENKIFVLEEPETNLHPRGLRALLSMVRESMKCNQFLIATHSNVVIRELAFDDQAKIFRVARESSKPGAPSTVEEVPRDPLHHASLLRELGYEFADLGLHEGWIFLEESSAELIIRQILIPTFVPELRGRIRTFAAGGTGNLEPSVAEFQRLTVFLHLQPIYKEKLWIRADGDDSGQLAIGKIRKSLPYLSQVQCNWFSEQYFEGYYPARFAEKVANVLAIEDKRLRQSAKTTLLLEVVNWSQANHADARAEWSASAAEIIDFLNLVKRSLGQPEGSRTASD